MLPVFNARPPKPPPLNATTASTSGSFAHVFASCVMRPAHGLKRGILIGDNRAVDPAGILLRERNLWG